MIFYERPQTRLIANIYRLPSDTTISPYALEEARSAVSSRLAGSQAPATSHSHLGVVGQDAATHRGPVRLLKLQ